MPRKSSSKPQQPVEASLPYATTADTPWGGYVNLSLSDGDKTAFQVWVELNADYMDSHLTDVVGEGVQLSLKYHIKEGGFSCTLTAKPHPDIDVRCCMTSWAGSPTQALHITLYKWLQILCKDMSDFRPSTGTFARWG